MCSNLYRDKNRVHFEFTVDVTCPTDEDKTPAIANPCLPEAEKKPAVYKCTVDGVSSYQSTPCAEAPAG